MGIPHTTKNVDFISKETSADPLAAANVPKALLIRWSWQLAKHSGWQVLWNVANYCRSFYCRSYIGNIWISYLNSISPGLLKVFLTPTLDLLLMSEWFGGQLEKSRVSEVLNQTSQWSPTCFKSEYSLVSLHHISYMTLSWVNNRSKLACKIGLWKKYHGVRYTYLWSGLFEKINPIPAGGSISIFSKSLPYGFL